MAPPPRRPAGAVVWAPPGTPRRSGVDFSEADSWASGVDPWSGGSGRSDSGPDPVAAGGAPAAEAARQAGRVLAGALLAGRAPRAGQWRPVRQILLGGADRALALLREADRRDRSTVGGWLDWLADGADPAPDWVVALSAVLSGTCLDEQRYRSGVAALGTGDLVELLGLALGQERGPAAVEWLWPDLVDAASTAVYADIRELLQRVPEVPVPTQAAIDLLRARYRLYPQPDPGRLVGEQRSGYLRELCQRLERPGGGADALLADLVEAQLSRMLTAPEDGQPAAGLLAELAGLLGTGRRDLVLDRLAAAAAHAPVVIAALPEQARDDLLERCADLRRRYAMECLERAVRSGATTAELAGHWVRARRGGATTTEVLASLARWPGATDAGEVDLLLVAVQHRVAGEHGPADGLASYLEALRCVLDGALGEVAGPMRELLWGTVHHHRQLAERLEKVLRGGRPWWTDPLGGRAPVRQGRPGEAVGQEVGQEAGGLTGGSGTAADRSGRTPARHSRR